MTARTSRTDRAFLEKQRHRLIELRRQILEARRRQETEQAAAKTEAGGQAREYEDDAQKLTLLELQDNLTAADDARLSNIERALQKIDDGSYGLSEGSGAPISI